MPITEDIMDHPIIGPRIRQGVRQGVQQGMRQGVQQGIRQGMEKGMEKGRQEGERLILLRMIGHRFGQVSPAVRKQIDALPVTGVEKLALRLFEASSLDELLKPAKPRATSRRPS